MMTLCMPFTMGYLFLAAWTSITYPIFGLTYTFFHPNFLIISCLRMT